MAPNEQNEGCFLHFVIQSICTTRQHAQKLIENTVHYVPPDFVITSGSSAGWFVSMM